VCHAFLSQSTFYHLLFRIDQSLADDEQKRGCSCGGVLHSANYPRKPRGIRSALDGSYEVRFSFCCCEDGCRRRRTPPSVRFLGRKVYLGVIVVLATALHHGLTEKRRRHLIETLDISDQTLSRWRRFWREAFVQSRCWQTERDCFIPPVDSGHLPGALLARLSGDKLSDRLCRLLLLICPLTTVSSAYLRVRIDPQKMRF
jgi:hypothetical protein